MQKFKINLHICEACNYYCKHCFAHFGSKNILPVWKWKLIVDNCLKFGKIEGFNIAGGEPLLYPELFDLIKYIKDKGCYCSIITNGSLVNEIWLRKFIPLLDVIGFSIDSFWEGRLRLMGRVDSRGNFVSIGKFKDMYSKIKEINPDCQIKVNTVVTQVNADDFIMGKILADMKISRWKILKMQTYVSNYFANTSIAITEHEYHKYISENFAIAGESSPSWGQTVAEIQGMKVVLENKMLGSYLIINPDGWLTDNSGSDGHTVPMVNCLIDDFSEGIKKVNFNTDLYLTRYR